MAMKVINEKYKIAVIIVISLSLLFGFVVKSSDIFFGLKMYDISDQCLKIMCKITNDDSKLITRSRRYNTMNMSEECFDMIEYVFINRDKNGSHTPTDILAFLEYGVYANKYKKVTEVFGLIKRAAENDEESDKILTVAIIELVQRCRRLDIDTRFKYYAIELIDFRMELYKDDESKMEHLETLAEYKKELESMLQ